MASPRDATASFCRRTYIRRANSTSRAPSATSSWSDRNLARPMFLSTNSAGFARWRVLDPPAKMPQEDLLVKSKMLLTVAFILVAPLFYELGSARTSTAPRSSVRLAQDPCGGHPVPGGVSVTPTPTPRTQSAFTPAQPSRPRTPS